METNGISNKRLRYSLWAALGIILLCSLASGIYWVATADSRAFAAFMDESYGPYDDKKKFWHQPEDNDLAHDVCARKDVGIKGEDHLLLAVCTFTQETDSHGQQGSVDFYVLKKDHGKLTTVASLRDVGSGAYGHPGSVEVVQAGPSFYGFRLEDGWTGQGYVLGTTTLYLPSNSTIEESFSIRSTFDSTGTGNCDSGPARSACSELERKVAFDSDTPNHGVFPLIVTESGTFEGKRINRKFIVPFNKSRWKYQPPKGLILDLG